MIARWRQVESRLMETSEEAREVGAPPAQQDGRASRRGQRIGHAEIGKGPTIHPFETPPAGGGLIWSPASGARER